MAATDRQICPQAVLDELDVLDNAVTTARLGDRRGAGRRGPPQAAGLMID